MYPYHYVSYDGQARQPNVLACGIIFAVVTPLAVILRFYSRWISRVGLWWDDWCALVALPMALAFNAIKLWQITIGFGAWPTPEIETNFPLFFKVFYCLELLYNTGLPFCKISILLLYRRVFPTKQMKIGCWILGALIFLWFLGTEVTIIFQCNPIRKAWNEHLPGKCYNLRAFLLGQAIPSIVTDFFILALPIRPVFKLQMPLYRKLAISSIFLLGSFAVICSIVRMPYALDSLKGDPSRTLYQFVPGDLWTDAELQICLICACLPTLRPTVAQCFGRFKTSRGGNRSYNTIGSNTYWQSTSASTAPQERAAEDRKRLTHSDSTVARDPFETTTGRGELIRNTGALGREDLELGDLGTPRQVEGVMKGDTIGVRREVQVFADDRV